MATSKTLTPTNETIQIPAMTDAPDASVFSNCIDKEADAINALNSNIANNYTDYDLTGKYHIRISQIGKMVTVSGVIFGTGIAEYLTAVPLPTPAKYDGGSELMGNAVIFYARNQNTGVTKQLRCGSSFYIYLESDMANGAPFAFAFSYCKA